MASFYSDKVAYKILKTQGFDPRDTAVYEPHYNESEELYYTFCNWQDNTNIIFKIDTEEIDLGS